MQKVNFYVPKEKNALATQMVARYGEFLKDMPLEARLTFRAALATFQISQHQWANSPHRPTLKRMIEDAIESVNSEAWQSEQLTSWIIGFCNDPQDNWFIEPMLRALSDSISQALG